MRASRQTSAGGAPLMRAPAERMHVSGTRDEPQRALPRGW